MDEAEDACVVDEDGDGIRLFDGGDGGIDRCFIGYVDSGGVGASTLAGDLGSGGVGGVVVDVPDRDVVTGLGEAEAALTRMDVYACYPYIVSMETSMSTSAAAARTDRIELRATREEKRLLAAAAAHERLDVTSFILRNVLPAARDIVERSERIRLSDRDAARVLELLENPPDPTAALLAAARRRAART